VPQQEVLELAARDLGGGRELKLAVDNFNNNLKASQRELKEFEKTIKPSVAAAKEIGSAMILAGGAIVTGMLAATKASVNYGDALNDMRQRTGASVETLARFGFAAEQSGSSVEGLGTGLKFLAKNLEAATGGSAEQIKAFSKLGISADELVDAHGNVSTVMLLVADRFKGMDDGAEKTALAMKIFGKSGADLIPLLNEGSDGLNRLGDTAQRAGLVISGDAAKAADEFNDTLTEMKASVLGASNGIAQALLPSLQSVASLTVGVIQQFGQFTKEHQALTQATFATGAALLGTGTALVGVAVVVPKLISGFGLMQSALAAVGVTVTAVSAGVVALGAALGIGIGSLVNWAIQGTAVERGLDAVSTQLLRSTGLLGVNAGVTKNLETETKRLSLELAAHGVIVERGNDSLESWNARVIAAAHNSDLFKNAVAKQAEAHASLTKELDVFAARSTGYVTGPGALMKELFEKSIQAGDELRQKIDALKESIGPTGVETSALNRALIELGREGVPLEVIITALGDKASVMGAALRALGKDVPPMISAIEDATDVFRKNADQVYIAEMGLYHYHAALAKLAEADFNLPIPADLDLAKLRDRLNKEFDELPLQPIGIPVKTPIVPRSVVQEMDRDLVRAIEDVKRSAGRIFDDMFVKGQSVFSSLKNLLKGGALSLGRSIFEDITGALLGPVKKAFNDFFTGLLKSTGIQSFVEGLGKKIGDTVKDAVGIGFDEAKKQVTSGVISNVSGAAGGAGGAGGGASSASGALGVVGIAVDAAGSIGVILQLKRLEGTMNAVEANTRFTYIELRDTMDQLLWPMLGHALAMRDDLHLATVQLDAIYNVLARQTATGGTTAKVSASSSGSVNIAVTNNYSAAVVGLTESDARNKLIPWMKSWGANNSRNFATDFTAMVKRNWNGIVVTAS